MARKPTRVERLWYAFSLIVCLAASGDLMYWKRNVPEGILGVFLVIVSGFLSARLAGLSPDPE